MGFFNPEMEDMLEVFESESLEFMDRMEDYLMAEEKRKQLSQDALQGIFRIVHTMKSSSAMMGLSDMSSCTHKLEDLFLLFRDEPQLSAKAGTQVFDVLFEYVDYVRGELQHMTEEDFTPASTSKLQSRIETVLAAVQAVEAQTLQQEQVQAKETESIEGEETGIHLKEQAVSLVTADEGEGTYHWKIHFEKNCQMENVRAYLLLKQLQPLCGQLFSVPEDLKATESAAKIEKNGLILYFTSSEADMVLQKLEASVYVREIEDLGEGESATAAVQVDEYAAEGKKSDLASQQSKPLSKMGMVSWQKILLLQNLTGELITLSGMMEKEGNRGRCSDRLEDLILDNRRLLSTLEDLVNSISLMPISGMVSQYSRAIRDISKKEDKEIQFLVQGEDLEVDKTLIDTLTSPLLHLIRNAADHGIESTAERIQAGKPPVGKIEFSVYLIGENLFFSVSDDGRGLDQDLILNKASELGMLSQKKADYGEDEIYQLLFKPGFSTSEKVSEYSGRGVGLDVVQKVADSLRGAVYAESKKGEGMRVTVSVPFSLTSVNSIQFRVGEHICFVPTKNVQHIFPYSQCEKRILEADGKEYLQEKSLIPLVRLSRIYSQRTALIESEQWEQPEENDQGFVMIVSGMKQNIAVVTSRIDGQCTIVEKALPNLIPQEYRKQTGINGCAVTAEGTIGFLLNIDWIIRGAERGELYGQTAACYEGE